MNRYILGAILGLITVFTIYGLENSGDFFNRATQSSRDAISSIPTSAAEGTGIESAGENVTRQTSEDALGQTTDLPTDPNFGQPPQQPTPAPVSPNAEAISGSR